MVAVRDDGHDHRLDRSVTWLGEGRRGEDKGEGVEQDGGVKE